MLRAALNPAKWPATIQGIAFFGLLFGAGYAWTHRSVPPAPKPLQEIVLRVANQEEIDTSSLWAVLGEQDTIAIQDDNGRVAYCGPPAALRDSMAAWQAGGLKLTWATVIGRLLHE